jgi:hypothetical protein
VSRDSKLTGLSETCQVCLGAIPDGETVNGHTALCAEVVRRETRQRALEEAAKIVEGFELDEDDSPRTIAKSIRAAAKRGDAT